MTNCNLVRTPLVSNSKLSKSMSKAKIPLKNGKIWSVFRIRMQ